MIFCKECGGALNLFETYDEEVCSACLRRESRPERPVADKKSELHLPAEAVFSHEGDKMVLRSPEGWVLWSGPDSESHSLVTIMNRARRIHEIRSKRPKKSD